MNTKMQSKGTSDIINQYSSIFKEMHGKCLHIGCSSENVIKNIILPKLPSDATLIVTDACEETLDCARRKYANEKRISVSHLDIDGQRVGEEHVGCYDNIISFYYLHRFQNLTRIFRNMNKLLKKGGQGFIVFFSHHDLYDFFLAYRTDPKFKQYMEDAFSQIPLLYGFPNGADIVKQALVGCTLETIVCKNEEMTFVHENLEELKGFLTSTDPFIGRMPDDIKELYLNQISRDLQSRIIQDGIPDTYRVAIVHFKKT